MCADSGHGSFPSLVKWSSPHAVSGCFLEDFWEKEAIYRRCMQNTTVNEDQAWLSCDHTFASAGNCFPSVILWEGAMHIIIVAGFN